MDKFSVQQFDDAVYRLKDAVWRFSLNIELLLEVEMMVSENIGLCAESKPPIYREQDFIDLLEKYKRRGL